MLVPIRPMALIAMATLLMACSQKPVNDDFSFPDEKRLEPYGEALLLRGTSKGAGKPQIVIPLGLPDGYGRKAENGRVIALTYSPAASAKLKITSKCEGNPYDTIENDKSRILLIKRARSLSSEDKGRDDRYHMWVDDIIVDGPIISC